MRTITTDTIIQNIKEMCIEANYSLTSDVKDKLYQAAEEENSPLGRQILSQLKENLQIAKDDEIPICQDTGMAVVFLRIGQDVHIEGQNLEDAVNEGIRQGYIEGYLRKSVVSDPILRENTKDNTPGVIHYEIIAGENIEITVAPKGFGSENMSRVCMLKPADGIEGVKNAVIETVKIAGPNACPPVVVGVGVGGTFEKCAILAKKALTRDLNTHNEISYVADLEKEHWKTCGDIINQLGCTIILPDYPLTPKYNYKDTINMMEALYKKVIQQVEPSNLVVMGDSAGGGLALALVEKMGEENIAMPNQTILISPWLDVRMNNPKIAEIEENDPMLNKAALKLAGENYAGKDGIDSYLVNPADGPLDKLQNVSIFTGTYDILNADVEVLKERAEKVGTKINVYETEKATHIWLLYKYKDKENDPLVQEPYKHMIELLKNN